MTEFPRSFFKNDPVLRKLFHILRDRHKAADHTEKTLLENRHIKDFCEEARHFVFMGGSPDLFIHYDTHSWFAHPMGVQVKIISIGVYDNFMEYETARMQQLHRAQNKDIPNLN